MLFAMSTKVNRFPARRADSPAALRACVLAAVLLALAACTHPGRGLKSCRYRFQTFTFTGMDAQQTHWQVDVAVTNPNAHEVTLTRMRYALLYQADTLLSGWNPEKKTVGANDSMMVRTSLDLPNTLFTRLPPGIWAQTDAQFVIVADAYLNTWVGDIVVPGAIRQTVHINMTEQLAKYKDMLMRRFFTWPGRHLEDGGINAPDGNPPAPGESAPSPPPQGDRTPQPGNDPAPNEHL
jgi:hypothetical protein